jgi:hypothetical protein
MYDNEDDIYEELDVTYYDIVEDLTFNKGKVENMSDATLYQVGMVYVDDISEAYKPMVLEAMRKFQMLEPFSDEDKDLLKSLIFFNNLRYFYNGN